jgi:predicted AlkP superfamily pyrophosphatase or phosphodiesterase
MREKLFYRSLLSVVFFCLATERSAFVEAAEGLAPKDRHVVLISIDGFPASSWRDQSIPLPNLRRLAEKGAVADAMGVSNPSITWINHTTLVTGVTPRKHGVLGNGLHLRSGSGGPVRIEQWVDRARMVFAPTVYDHAFYQGLTVGEVDWVAIKNAGTVHWSFPEIPEVEGALEGEMIRAGKLTEEEVKWMTPGAGRKSPSFMDALWNRAACYLIETHRPNLLMLHYLNTDAAHHAAGPGSAAGATALAYADRLVGDVVESVRRAGLEERTTFVITTDHGFKRVEKAIYPGVLLRQKGLAEVFGQKYAGGDVSALPMGGMCLVFVNRPTKKAELAPKIREIFGSLEGVAEVMDADDAPRLGMPTAAENAGMGDFILFAKNGYAFQPGASGDAVVTLSSNYRGTHGYRADDPELDGIFLAVGRGVKPGTRLGRISNLDVAPTVARLLGIPMEGVDGKVLEGALKE